jgi:6-pyruvoyl-tetrahydropterin synthase
LGKEIGLKLAPKADSFQVPKIRIASLQARNSAIHPTNCLPLKTHVPPGVISSTATYTIAMTSSRLSLRRSFVADHFHDLPGFVEARHGHNWELEASMRFEDSTPDSGFAKALDTWVEGIDYSLLNERPWLEGRNPTAEALAQWLLEHLESQGFQEVEVKIREKANYWAACHRETE